MRTSAPPASRSTRRALLLSGGTALVYACWAALANSAHGLFLALRSAAAQCFITFSLTLVMTLVVERLHRIGTTPLRRVTGATLGSIGTTCAVSFTIHTLAGTPEIARTMLPPMSIGLVYCLLSALRLERLRQKA